MQTKYFLLTILLLVFSAIHANESRQGKISVLFTNDIHGGTVPVKAEFLNPEFPPMLGGAPAAAALIKRARAAAEARGDATLLIDGGDTFQGTLVGTRSKGMAIVEYMNHIGYDAVVPGNHDFDLGKDNLIEMIKASTFNWVAANIYDQETGQRWEWVKPWVILEKAGLKIGITGATTMGTASMSFPENIRGLEFREEITELQEVVDQLRDQKVDLVVVLLHIGLPYDAKEGYEDLQKQTIESVKQKGYVNAMEIAHYVRGIDLLAGGHLHRGYQNVWEDPINHTICMQNYANGSNLGWLEVEIDRPTRSISGYEYVADDNALLLLQQDQFWPDSSTLALVDSQRAKYEIGFSDIIGSSKTPLTRSSLGEGPLNNLICDVMCEATGADFSFMNFGGIRADIKAGPITREDVFKVLPFGNELVSFEASGAFLKAILEAKVAGGGRGLSIGGAKVVINRSRESGDRVVSIEIDGQPLDPAKTYRIATTDYLMEGNSGLMLLLRIPKNKVNYQGKLLRDALIEVFDPDKPLDIRTDGRWKSDDDATPSENWKQKFSR